jgi:gluconolactonase
VDVNGEISVLSSGIESAPFVMPNFPVWDEHGNLFVTDSGNFYKPSGRLFRISKDGTTACVYGGHLHFPNGLVISPDGKWLYMIQSTAVNILRFSLSNGIIGEPELYFTLPGTVPDGLAFSESGNLYVACYTPDIIYRITPNRILQTVVADPYGERLNRPTNVAFAPGTTMLCFANLGGYAIHGLDVGEKGAPLFYP